MTVKLISSVLKILYRSMFSKKKKKCTQNKIQKLPAMLFFVTDSYDVTRVCPFEPSKTKVPILCTNIDTIQHLSS